MKSSLAQWVLFLVVVPLAVISCDLCGNPEDEIPECFPNERRCLVIAQANFVQVCEDGFFVEEVDCERDEFCVEEWPWAICVHDDCDTEASDFCIPVGAKDCDGTVLQECQGRRCPVWTYVEDCADSDLVCEVLDVEQDELGEAICVAGTGGTGGTGGMAGSGGTAGAGGGTGSCLEIDIPGEPNLTGPLSISPSAASFDDVVTVTVGVDGDTQEVTAILRNSNSDVGGGTGFATTSGNEALPVVVLVGTVADPGPQVVDLELRADASNRVDYVLYTSGDGDNYVRINVEEDIPGPETETTCLELKCDIEF